MLEKTDRARPVPIIDDLPLFSAARKEKEEAEEHPALTALAAVNPDGARRRRRWRRFTS